MTKNISANITVLTRNITTPEGGRAVISGSATKTTTLTNDLDEILSVEIEPVGTIKIGNSYNRVSAENLDVVIEVATALRDFIAPKPEEPEEPEPLTAAERLQQLIARAKIDLERVHDPSNRGYYNGLLSGYENALLLIQQEDADGLG